MTANATKHAITKSANGITATAKNHAMEIARNLGSTMENAIQTARSQRLADMTDRIA